ANTGSSNGATPSLAQILRAPPSCSLRSPPHAKPSFTAASSIASSQPSTPTTGTTRPNGCSAPPPSSANSVFRLDFHYVCSYNVLVGRRFEQPARFWTSCIG